MNRLHQAAKEAALLLAAALIAGCAAVGPDYVRPTDQAPAAWHTPLVGGLSAGALNPDTLAAWWTTLGDPQLTELIERAVKGNLDLKQARSRLVQARASRGISRAGYLPELDGSAAASQSHSSGGSGSGRTTEMYSTGLDAKWELDLFGGVRRSVEASTAEVEASQEDLRDVLVSLSAEVALGYVELRTYQARLAVAERNLTAQGETWQLTRWRTQAGLQDELAVDQAGYNLESTRSQIPTLRTGEEAALNRLAVLLGEQPGNLHAELAATRPVPVTPLSVAVGVPAEALRQRPDIRRAERQLAAQTARVGVAVADLYPKFNLSGSIGLESLALNKLFSTDSKTTNAGSLISLPLFRGGSIRNNIKVQTALQEQSLLAYESAVLGALEEVENALTAYAREQERRTTLSTAEQAARSAAELSQQQYQAGLADFSQVLEAQRSLLSFQDQLAQSEGTVTSDLVRLYKALGGGWTALAPETQR